MINLYFGIATILLSILLFFLAYKEVKKNKYNTAILLIVFSGLLLRVFVGCDFFLHEWDERYHALVAKNMIAIPFKPMLYVDPLLSYDFESWTTNHVWLHKQPFPLWVMALSMKLIGVNELALRLPSILLSTIAIYFTYQIGLFFFNKKIGLLAAFFHSIHGLIIELTGGRVTTDHVDVFFLVLIELSVFLGIKYLDRKRFVFLLLSGLSLGCAVLTKWLPALIALPVLGIIYWKKGKLKIGKSALLISVILLIAVMVAAPWQFYIHSQFPKEAIWESNYNWLHFTTVIEGHQGGFFYHFLKMQIIWGELIYLPLLWFVYRVIIKKDWIKLALLIWVIVPYLFFSFAKTKIQGYLLFTAPAVFIVLSYHCLILKNKNLYFGNKWLSKIILFLLIALPIRYSMERVKPFQIKDRSPEWVATIKRIGKKYSGEKTVLFNYDRPIEAMFYTDMIVYSALPEKEKILEIIDKGYRVLIWDDENAKPFISKIPDVEWVK